MKQEKKPVTYDDLGKYVRTYDEMPRIPYDELQAWLAERLAEKEK